MSRIAEMRERIKARQGDRSDTQIEKGIKVSTALQGRPRPDVSINNSKRTAEDHSKAIKKKIAAGWSPTTANFEKYNAETSKKAQAFDKEGNFVAEYPSLAEAARQLGISRSGIVGAMKRNGTAGGFSWKVV